MNIEDDDTYFGESYSDYIRRSREREAYEKAQREGYRRDSESRRKSEPVWSPSESNDDFGSMW